MKKIFALFLVMLLVLSGLSAVAEEDTLSGTLKYMFWGSTVERDIVEGICKSYMELHPNVTIETLYTPSDYDTKITTLAAANDLPDIAYMNSLLALEMARNGYIKDIGPLIDADPEITRDSFVPGCLQVLDDGFVLGRRIGIAGYCMYYNEDMVKEAGLEPMPDNWQGFDQFPIFDVPPQCAKPPKVSLNRGIPRFFPGRLIRFFIARRTRYAPGRCLRSEQSSPVSNLGCRAIWLSEGICLIVLRIFQ